MTHDIFVLITANKCSHPTLNSYTGNEFFLTATGLSEREAKQLTIFSIVQSNQLSNLYKMVARALADKSVTSSAAGNTSSNSQTTNDSASATKSDSPDNEEWQAITLKCIPFLSHGKGNDSNQTRTAEATTEITTHHPNPLYITVALMEDGNRDQRCFHCVLTDCPGTNGKLGSLTPELFDMLFTPSRSVGKKKTGLGAK